MSLKEVLDFMDEAVPALPGQVTGVLKEGEEFKRQATQLLADFARRRSEAKGLFEQCRRSLAALGEGAQSQAARLQGGVEAVESRADVSASDLQVGGAELTSGLADAGSAMVVLQETLTETGDASRAAEQRVAAALDGVGDEIDGGREDLGTALEAATAQASSLAALAEQVRDQVGAAAGSLKTKMDGLLAEAQGRIAGTLGCLADLKAAHEDVLAAELDHLDAKKSEILDRLQGTLANDVEGVVGAAVDTVVDALAALGAGFQGTKDRLAAVRGELDSVVEALGSAIEPFPGYIASVKDTATQTGVQWT